MYPATIERESGKRIEARIIDAVDTDGTIYVLTRTPGTTEGIVVTADDSDDETITLCRRLITLTYPDGTNP